MGDLSSVSLGQSEQDLELREVRDNEHLVARGNHVTGLLVRTVANLGHAESTTEATTDTRVNTLGLAPLISKTLVTVVVVTLERLAVLLVDSGAGECLCHG